MFILFILPRGLPSVTTDRVNLLSILESYVTEIGSRLNPAKKQLGVKSLRFSISASFSEWHGLFNCQVSYITISTQK